MPKFKHNFLVFILSFLSSMPSSELLFYRLAHSMSYPLMYNTSLDGDKRHTKLDKNGKIYCNIVVFLA